MWSRCVVSQVKHNSYFVAGLAAGLWLTLASVDLEEGGAVCGPRPAAGADGAGGADEFAPLVTQRAAAAQGGRAVQRPRYYSTELGMRGAVLGGVVAERLALGGRGAALNGTARGVPLRFFIAAGGGAHQPLPNVVGFTDSREMLRPFHALKYLADNYLDEYDFFFLTTDTTYVNARRLTELVGKLSISQDLYMGVVDEEDSNYCTLEGGVLLSNSVVRSVHAQLEWCVRNSYSARHHENVGRCVTHAARQRCRTSAQGQEYRAARHTDALSPSLADAVTVRGLDTPEHFYQLHAYISRVYLERDAARQRALRAELAAAGGAEHRWPYGLRAHPAPAANRFDHVRWTSFNATHALLPTDLAAAAPLSAAHRAAVQMVVEEARAWASHRWGGEVELVEGSWRWQPAAGLFYRLLVVHRGPEGTRVRMLEACRALGGARLVPAPYVTESARLAVVVALPADSAPPALPPPLAALPAHNAQLLLVLVSPHNATAPPPPALPATVLTATLPPHARHDDQDAIDRAALQAVRGRVPRDAPLVMVDLAAHFNDDFLNRVRMNTLPGQQWFAALPFARFAQYAHPRFVTPTGGKPSVNTGRFNERGRAALAFTYSDYEEALSMLGVAAAERSVADILAEGGRARCVRGPDPALLTPPPPAPCPPPPTDGGRCVGGLRHAGLARLELGARRTLSELYLQLHEPQHD